MSDEPIAFLIPSPDLVPQGPKFKIHDGGNAIAKSEAIVNGQGAVVVRINEPGRHTNSPSARGLGAGEWCLADRGDAIAREGDVGYPIKARSRIH